MVFVLVLEGRWANPVIVDIIIGGIWPFAYF